MPDTYKTLKLRAHEVKSEDRLEVAGKMYNVVSVARNSFDWDMHMITLRRLNGSLEATRLHMHQDSKLVVFRKTSK